ncbi:hypothetical protein ECZU45_38900 [Escherichia coli]|nr:hypothetical protein ECZU45_38900 [Escherichia coli]
MAERRRIWRKLHLAVDSKTHEIICADLSLNNVTDSEAFRVNPANPPENQVSRRRWRLRYRLCHDELRRKKISALIPPRKVRVTGPVNMRTVTVQWLISE